MIFKKIFILFILAVLSAACQTGQQAPMYPKVSVDLNRYLGQWYEVALIPNRFQKMCASDTQANYALENTWTGDSIRVINRCRKADGRVETAIGVAKVLEGSMNTKLRVSFFRPFYGNYWILALGDNYDWVLVGEPSRQYGWVLSRKPQLSAAHLNAALAVAQSYGYTQEQFMSTLQTQPIVSE